MVRRTISACILLGGLLVCLMGERGRAENAYGRAWGGTHSTQDWNNFYHYPYVYYPQNFWGNEYYRSADSMYFRYPPEMRIPVYNRRWFNYYPNNRARMYDQLLQREIPGNRYHSGHHFILDVF